MAVSDAEMAQWCRSVLGAAPARTIFQRAHLSDVLGFELGDGRQVVIKVRPGPPRLEAVTAIQRHVARQGFPCPNVLAGPLPLGDRVATAEEYISRRGDAEGPPLPAPMAQLLAELMSCLPPVDDAADLSPAPPWVGWDHPSAQLWPWPDDLDVDLNDHLGPDWLDGTAARIRQRMQADTGPAVIGHVDWEANNVACEDGVPVVVHDWDSLAVRIEAAIAGAAAAVFPALGTTVAATGEQTGTFLDAYREARPTHWRADSEDELALRSRHAGIRS